jgi:argininosuccinate lyase
LVHANDCNVTVSIVDGSIRARSGAGGTALPRVLEQIANLRKLLLKKES